jgi:WD repeat and SOF domain-containing protein 1
MKVKVLKRSGADYLRESKDEIHKLPRNYSPSAHPMEEAREYKRAMNAVKLEKVFAKPFMANLDGHRDGVSKLATHPQRLSTLASCSFDGDVKLWDLASKKCLVTCEGHAGRYARDLCFTPDGSKLLSVGDDCQIRIWDTSGLIEEETGVRKCADSILTKSTLTGITHHRSDPHVATCGQASTTLWDLTLQSPVSEYQWGVDSVHCVKFNQVETNIIGACASDRSILLYDTRETRPMRKVVLEMRTNALAWNPMEAFVFLAGNEDYNTYAFDMRNLKRPLNVHMGHIGAVIDVDYAPTGREFVSGSYDKTLRLYSTDQGRSREVYHTKRMQRLTSVAWTRDNRYILSGSDEMNIRLWKARASEKLGIMKDREKTAIDYANKLKEKYAHHPEVARIVRHKHVPKHVLNNASQIAEQKAGKKRKEANVRKHSKAGKVPHVSERDSHLVKEQE